MEGAGGVGEGQGYLRAVLLLCSLELCTLAPAGLVALNYTNPKTLPPHNLGPYSGRRMSWPSRHQPLWQPLSAKPRPFSCPVRVLTEHVGLPLPLPLSLSLQVLKIGPTCPLPPPSSAPCRR